MGSISVDLALIIQLFSLGFFKDLGNLVIDHDKTVILIKRVYIPQIYLFHFYSPLVVGLLAANKKEAADCGISVRQDSQLYSFGCK
jgi:hypothetical protein